MATRTKVTSFFLIGLIIVSGMALIGWVLPGKSTLGIWNSFPTTSQCSNSLDSCELFGKSIWRNIFDMGTVNTGYGAHLIVDCITPSNTPGAFLQLQYANVTTSSMANATNWKNLGSPVYIDNAVHTSVLFPCPGQLKDGFPSSFQSNIPGQPPDSLLFRVIGNGGGGSGDNPRFGFIGVQINLNNERIGYPLVLSKSSTGFTVREYMTFQAASANVMQFSWTATNITTTGCGILNPANPTVTDHCWEAGSSSCTMVVAAVFCSATITFTTAFSITPQVFITNTVASGVSNSFISVATIPLFGASQ